MKEGLTQAEISKELDVPLNTCRNWEKRGLGRRMPCVKMLGKIARILNTTLDELIGQ